MRTVEVITLHDPHEYTLAEKHSFIRLAAWLGRGALFVVIELRERSER